MSWLFFSLISALLWGIGQVIIKRGFLNLSSLWNVVISASINILIYIPFALYNKASLAIPFTYLCILFVITFFYIFFFYAIEKGQLVFSGTIFATYPVTTIILSFIFLNERPHFMQFFMIGLVITGCMLLTYFTDKTKKGGKIQLSWVFWALLGAITTGAADFLAKIVLNNIQIQTYNFYYPIVYTLSLGLFWIFDKNGRALSKKISLKQIVTTSIGISMLTIGLLSLNYAFALGKASLVSTISSSYIG